MVIFIRCNDIKPDPRLQKYIDYLDSIKMGYKIIAWDRLGKGFYDTDSILYYRKLCPFGRGLKNLLKKIGWMFFVIKNLSEQNLLGIEEKIEWCVTNNEELRRMGVNAKLLWDSKFVSMIDSFMNTQYRKMIDL
ncbi:hypothetical protein [Sinanaerobacter sp. ZZT-01]|uniref:hypothetical protein n=1 Tax=Sinanaerobacter sp. ZZT-01 TaxID=3111540 RepID=UPI002D778633|nr:hypothetical protein [Sinanaerobacter sp. ZZT-01]WRR94884.1 hypothetical protein U5921_07130 [Sinanaerobacter sp. ZZT-01]